MNRNTLQHLTTGLILVLTLILLITIIRTFYNFTTGATELNVNVQHTTIPFSETSSGKPYNPQQTVDGKTLQGSEL